MWHLTTSATVFNQQDLIKCNQNECTNLCTKINVLKLCWWVHFSSDFFDQTFFVQNCSDILNGNNERKKYSKDIFNWRVRWCGQCISGCTECYDSCTIWMYAFKNEYAPTNHYRHLSITKFWTWTCPCPRTCLGLNNAVMVDLSD